MISTLFVLFVIIGFVCKFLATWPISPYAERAAWGCWLIAAILWAVPQIHGGS